MIYDAIFRLLLTRLAELTLNPYTAGLDAHDVARANQLAMDTSALSNVVRKPTASRTAHLHRRFSDAAWSYEQEHTAETLQNNPRVAALVHTGDAMAHFAIALDRGVQNKDMREVMAHLNATASIIEAAEEARDNVRHAF
jgi:hypothetical protein